MDLASDQPAAAVDLVRSGLSRAPRSRLLYDALARLELQIHGYSEAQGAAEQALEIDPADEEAVQYLANAQAAQGNGSGAINTWQGWINAHAEDGDAVAMLAQMQEQQGHIDQAIASYRQALRIKPGIGLAENNLAYLMVENHGNVDEALNLAQDARRNLPDQPGTEDTLAWVYYYKGRYPSARDMLRDVLKADPKDGVAEYHLGMTYSKLGSKADAASHLKKAIALSGSSPTSTAASTALASLQ